MDVMRSGEIIINGTAFTETTYGARKKYVVIDLSIIVINYDLTCSWTEYDLSDTTFSGIFHHCKQHNHLPCILKDW